MKKYRTFLLWLSSMVFSYSQELTKEKELNDLIDELFMEDDIINELVASLKNYQFLYISTTFNSDTYFSGRAGYIGSNCASDIGLNCATFVVWT